jgi:hypothetical protein
MGFFDKIKSAVGVGQPEVQISLDRAVVGQGGIITGSARATGKERPLPVTAFDVFIRRHSQQQGMTTLSKDRIPFGGAQLQPERSMDIRFELQVPAGSPPTGGDIRYEVIVGLDVPGLDPTASADLQVTPQPEATVQEDFNRYHLIPTAHSFRHSSVRGDFRLVRLADGFAVYWKDSLSFHNSDGSRRAMVSGWGRVAAATTDGMGVLAVDGKTMAFFDPRSGEMQGQPIDLGAWINNVAFLRDGSGIVLNATDKLILTDPQGNVKQEIANLGLGGDLYVSSLCAGPQGGRFYCVDANKNKIVACDAAQGVLGSANVMNPSDVHLSEDGGSLHVGSSSDVHVLDLQLQPRASYRIPGKEGVRFVGMAEHSYTHFHSNAHLSPDNRFMLVNDGTGLLWLLDSGNGEPMRRYDRAILSWVEDTMWWDQNHFLAITNDGQVHGLALDGTKVFEHPSA